MKKQVILLAFIILLIGGCNNKKTLSQSRLDNIIKWSNEIAVDAEWDYWTTSYQNYNLVAINRYMHYRKDNLLYYVVCEHLLDNESSISVAVFDTSSQFVEWRLWYRITGDGEWLRVVNDNGRVNKYVDGILDGEQEFAATTALIPNELMPAVFRYHHLQANENFDAVYTDRYGIKVEGDRLSIESARIDCGENLNIDSNMTIYKGSDDKYWQVSQDGKILMTWSNGLLGTEYEMRVSHSSVESMGFVPNSFFEVKELLD